jgi:long-chain acyl-CoA synthetase
VARRGWGPELRKGDSFPLTILNMMVLTTVLTAQAGGTAVIMDQSDVKSIVERIVADRVTIWNGAPAQLHTLVADERITREDLANLAEVWVGGGDCPDRLRDAFEARFGVRVSRTYGLTEAPALVSIDDLVGPRPTASGPWAGRYRPTLGYWKQARAALTLRTGDLGVVEPSGHVRVLGRKAQLIIRGGANVYPAEVERVLVAAPGVAAAAVVGVADERLGERVAAVVERRPGEVAEAGAILDHCRRELAAYKVPDRLIVVDRLPRNQMGKVPREAVLALLAS